MTRSRSAINSQVNCPEGIKDLPEAVELGRAEFLAYRAPWVGSELTDPAGDVGLDGAQYVAGVERVAEEPGRVLQAPSREPAIRPDPLLQLVSRGLPDRPYKLTSSSHGIRAVV